MRKLFSLFCFSILLFSLFCLSILFFTTISCSRDDDPNPAPAIPIKENIPSKYHGIWNIKYKDNVDIGVSGSHFKFTADEATVAINTYTDNNGSISIHQNSFTFPAGYQEKPIEQIIILDGGIKLEIRPSQNYLGYLEFILRQEGKTPITYIAKKE